MAGTYRVVVKDGDSRYVLEDDKYVFQTIDYVIDYEHFTEALTEFLSWTDNGDGVDKTRLVYIPEKIEQGKKKKK